MSYTRKYHERIGAKYNGSIAFYMKPIKRGDEYDYELVINDAGTAENVRVSKGKGQAYRVDYNGTAYEDIETNILVDTIPFDNSVKGCNTSVNALTGAVVATEAAQIASIDANAKKVGSTIVEGFFKTIRSEISQQIAELSSRLDSHLAHLYAMAKRCVEKQTQMQDDYQRIASRYLKIFEDLDNELSNRIHELDKPAFVFKSQSDSHAGRTLTGDLASTVAVFGAEGGDLQAKITASVTKKRALDTIGKANTFLVKQKRLKDTINQTVLNESVQAVQYSPVCYIETQNEKSQIGKKLYQADFLPKMQANETISDFQALTWSAVSKDNAEKIGRYFNAEVSSHYSESDTHTNRVRENIIKMLNISSIKSV
jgi:hypothetical protein